MRRTQFGNNNAYCQDDETSWFDWSLLDKHADVHRFVTLITARRALRGTGHERQRVSLSRLLQQAQKTWHGVRFGQPDWSHDSHSIALEAEVRQEGICIYLILNAYWEPLDFELPRGNVGRPSAWRRWIDTSLGSPEDIVPWQMAPSLCGPTYRAAARTVVVLFR